MIDATNELLKNKPNIITEASFKYDNNFCSVDILKNDEDGVEIYEVKSSTEVRDIYLDDISYQYYVLSNLGFNVKKACLVHVNSEYVLHGELNIHEYFVIEDETEIVKEKQEEVSAIIDQQNIFMKEHDENNEPETKLDKKCKSPYECDYWAYCTRDLPEDNVFKIFNMGFDKKIKFYNEGKISFEDLINEKMTDSFKQQIDFEINNKVPEIDKEAIRELLNSLKYPLYFIDFESFSLPIPEYEGTKPYQQLCFQYSLHIVEHEGAELEHKEFLADPDDKEFMRHFAESMIKDMKKPGTMIVYNKGFEVDKTIKLVEQFPDLKEDLLRILENVVDFMVPFHKRQYYAKEMEGSYSIKKVLPTLFPDDPELDYHNLPLVHVGTEASETFLAMKDMDEEERAKAREGLLVYCKLDTYAMVKIWERFKEVVDK